MASASSLCLRSHLYLRSPGWKLEFPEYGKSYMFAWFSHNMILFACWKPNYFQILALFQATEHAWTWIISPNVVFLVDIIPESENLDNVFSELKIAALFFRCVEMSYYDSSK